MLNSVMASLRVTFQAIYGYSCESRQIDLQKRPYDLACYELMQIRRHKMTFYTWNPMRMLFLARQCIFMHSIINQYAPYDISHIDVSQYHIA